MCPIPRVGSESDMVPILAKAGDLADAAVFEILVDGYHGVKLPWKTNNPKQGKQWWCFSALISGKHHPVEVRLFGPGS